MVEKEKSMSERIDEKTFQEKAEITIGEMENALGKLEESHDLEVDNQGGALKVSFEEPPGIFVISPNGSARQIWVFGPLLPASSSTGRKKKGPSFSQATGIQKLSANCSPAL